ncbi:MAG: hypothetical protein N3D84_04005, partial [Candidatus Woesearchaeota archaeon]|nr:hypothetical protein [Candidatus Woesearchaeota archaeon]
DSISKMETKKDNENTSPDFELTPGDIVEELNKYVIGQDEAKKIVEIVGEKLDEDARIIWGAQISEDMKNTIRTLLIVTGVKSAQIFGREKTSTSKLKKDIENELGIEFID